jgi:hypothetical protein
MERTKEMIKTSVRTDVIRLIFEQKYSEFKTEMLKPPH